MYSLPFVGVTDQTVAVHSQGHQGFGGGQHAGPYPHSLSPFCGHHPNNWIDRFRGDSVLRHLNLQMGGGLKCGLSTPFFNSFQRARVAPAYFPSPPTVFGRPAQPNVPLSQAVFNALFRHFLYELGDDLRLPRGAYYAGSSCVAALRLPPWVNQLTLHSLERKARTKIAEGLVERTLSK